MRPHPALSSALLAGWILATPPVDWEAIKAWTQSKTWEKGSTRPAPVRTHAPRRQWANVQAFDTAAECEKGRVALRATKPTAPAKPGFPPTYSDMQEYARASARFYAECLDACTFR